jgi:hypothetical protein
MLIKDSDNNDTNHDHHLGISPLPRSDATAPAPAFITVHAVATNVNDLAVQVLQLLQPLCLLIMIL